MKCTRCGFESPDGFTFCGKCGAPLAPPGCPRCGFENPSGFAFCGKCGAPLGVVEDRLTTADLDHLRAYLAPPLVEELLLDLAAPAPVLLERCIAHLSTLLETVYTHLPPYLVEWVMQNPKPGKTGGQFMDGTLLFADISGFTAMSERLSRIGREGAEEINGIVNRYFGTMLSILREHHGQLVEFYGDALLGLFLEPDSATRAVQAAQSMQTAMGAFAQTETSQGVFAVQMKVGIHRGHFFAAQLGTPRGMDYALFGADVNATAATESAAIAGQVLFDSATLQSISVPCRTLPASGAPYVVLEHVEPSPMLPHFPGPPLPHFEPSLQGLRSAVELLDALTPYLPAGLLARLASDPHAQGVQGEHRLVAVLFANVVGLGEIVNRLGAGREEQIVAALNQYLIAMERAIHRFGGVINSVDLNDRGDKLYSFFGAPLAHEDDAERAVRAALAMQETLQEIGCSLPVEAGLADLCLSQRIGISTGYVFAGYVGTSWRHDYTAMGDDVNLAARLMAKAEPGSIVVSGDVRRKVQALFDLASLGEVQVKGKSRPISIFSVAGVRAIPEPLRGVEGMRSPLVGRQAEWEQLQAAMSALPSGRGQIVSVIGEAGLGKSRLVTEMREAERAVRWVEGRCLSYTESVSYWPFQDLIRRLIGLRPDDSEQEAWNKLRAALEQRLAPEEVHENLPFLAGFLKLPLEGALLEQAHHLDAEALQRRTFIAIGMLIEAYVKAEPTPLVLVLDDIHWLDQASQALLEHLMPLVNRVPLMLLLLYRPERAKACWQIHDKAAREFAHCVTEVNLRPLAPEHSQRLLANLVGVGRWPTGVREVIVSHTEGNPLYVEEVLRALIDEQTLIRGEDGLWQVRGDLGSIKVPDTLQGVMMTRLDRMEEPIRWTAQVASVVGRVFPFDILAHVHTEGDGQLNQHLVALQQHEIVHETQRAPELVYTFKHGMMQEVCYRSLLTRTRRLYHRRVAEYLESRQSRVEMESNYALIAQHAFEGQDWPRALRYQFLAGQQARQLYANHEALEHFEKALRSADNLDAGETAEQRQAIHIAMGELLTITGQYEPAREHLGQALSLTAPRDDRDGRACVCRWLARLHELSGEYAPALDWVRQGLEALAGRETAEAAELLLIAGLVHTRLGDYGEALKCCEDGLRIAQGLDKVSVLARAHNLLGVIRLRSNGAQAIESFQQAFALYERAGDLAGQATSHNQIANACFSLGRWEEAEAHYCEARLIFDKLGDVYHRATTDNNLGGLMRNQGRLAEALMFYQEALHALEQIGGSRWVLGVLHMNLGATFVRQGEVETARQHLRTSQEYFQEAGARDFLPELHRHFAEAALTAGELPEAEVQGGQALELARELEARGEEGCALRVAGEVATAQGRLDQAEDPLRQSVAILGEVGDEYENACSQLALARLYIAQGNIEDGLAVVAQCMPTFDRLGAGLDLSAARALAEKAV
jgi:class 3 adenylate cyclase/tetratricopeptide (TPR) repeat protein